MTKLQLASHCKYWEPPVLSPKKKLSQAVLLPMHPAVDVHRRQQLGSLQQWHRRVGLRTSGDVQVAENDPIL